MRPNTVKFVESPHNRCPSMPEIWCRCSEVYFSLTSPRNLTLDKFRGLFAGLDFGKCRKVMIYLYPDISRVEQLIEAGFDKFQFHFSPDISEEKISQ